MLITTNIVNCNAIFIDIISPQQPHLQMSVHKHYALLFCNLNYSWSVFDLFLSLDEILCFVVKHCQMVDLRFFLFCKPVYYVIRYFGK